MHNLARYLGLVTISVLLLSACGPQATPVPTLAPYVFYTQAAQTMVAQDTMQAGATAVAELTRIASIPTGTPSPIPPLPSPTVPAPTATSLPATPTLIPTPMDCNHAQLVMDIPVANNANLTPGSAFTKVWQVQNIGACVWTQYYSLVLVGGMASYYSSQVPLPGTIRPGDVVALTVSGSAPMQPGNYTDSWMLRDAQGGAFGVGVNGAAPLTFQYTVAQPYGGSAVLNWHRQGGSNSVCDELRIYLNGNQSGTAIASSCKNPQRTLGSIALTPDELVRVLDWVNRFSDYNAEIYSAIPGGPPLQAYMTFNGQGSTSASDADIQMMQAMAESLFNDITS